jgi:hypothetical protein
MVNISHSKILNIDNINVVDAPPNSLMDSITNFKGENNGRIKSLGTLLGL